MLKLKLSELKKLEWNPRTIKKEDLDKLTKSIEKFWVIEWRPFLVSNRTGENIIIWGNQRYEVCKKLGIKEVPVHIMEWLSEEEEKEIIIRDNISNWEWDWDILANEWDKEELEEWWLDVQFETVEPEAEEDEFEVDEGIKTDIVLWDLFEIWPHRLLCWDSTNIDDVNKLMNGEKADMVFTDPPYNVAYEWGSKKRDAIANDKIDNFYQFLYDTYLNCFLIMRDGSPIYVAHSELERINFTLAFLDAWFKFSSLIIWVKNNSTFSMNKDYKQKHEPIIYWWKQWWNHTWEWGNCEDTVWEIKRPSKSDLHPTMKPIELCERGIKNSSIINAIVYEPFTWSGSTMVASHQINRRCYGMELDPKYVQTIINRMIKLDSSIEIKRNWVPYEISDVTVK